MTGGFVFPELNTPGVKTAQVKDTEGVAVYQRKNRLNRRLREERTRETKTNSSVSKFCLPSLNTYMLLNPIPTLDSLSCRKSYSC